jgi:hypothetical protein
MNATSDADSAPGGRGERDPTNAPAGNGSSSASPTLWLTRSPRRSRSALSAPTRHGRGSGSQAWRAAFLHPPAGLTTRRHTPEVAGLEIHGPRVTLRTIPARLHAWLRRIDRWIAYANSVVEE